MPRNQMEDIVDEFLPQALDKYPDTCKCPRCVKDIKAIALNHLKPVYTVSEQGDVYAKLNRLRLQFNVDVTNAIAQAIEIVSKAPRCGK